MSNHRLEIKTDKNGNGPIFMDGVEVGQCKILCLKTVLCRDEAINVKCLYSTVDEDTYDVARDADTLWNYMPEVSTINMEGLYEHFGWSKSRIDTAFKVLEKSDRIKWYNKKTDPDLFRRV